MKAPSLRVASEGIDLTARSASDHRSARRVLPQVVQSALQRVTTERWVIDLVVVALAEFLIAVSAVYGLAVVSTRMPAAHSQTALHESDSDHLVDSDAVKGRDSFGVCDELWCFRETR